MGVLNIIPFLQKQCPHVLKCFDDRFKSFRGKTIILDGTLITHRFHYASIPHNYRHIYGWFKLISELKKNDIQPICIFDGAGRPSAKFRENEKRRSARQLSAKRGSMEAVRLQRLKGVNKVLKQIQNLPSYDHITESQDVEKESPVFVPNHDYRPYIAWNYDYSRRPWVDNRPALVTPSKAHIEEVKGVVEVQTTPHMNEEEKEPKTGIIEEVVEVQTTIHTTVEEKEPTEEVVEVQTTLHTTVEEKLQKIGLTEEGIEEIEKIEKIEEAEEVKEVQEILEEEQPRVTPEMLSEQLALLHEMYQSSITDNKVSESDAVTGTSTSEDDISESKTQHELSQEEAQMWSEIQNIVKRPNEISTISSIDRLIERSQVISDSYEKRSKPPTQETYTECITLLEAMGLPCLESGHDHEAEGLAASLVLSGSADMVASEDTDVLVYGAPLLRNVTSRSGPLSLLSPDEIRDALGFSKEAFTDFALLCGTDFSPRLYKLGPVRAQGFIRKYSGIEEIIEEEARYAPAPENRRAYLDQVKRAREIFCNLPPVPKKRELEQKEMDNRLVHDLLDQFYLSKILANEEWTEKVALGENYFSDSPHGEGAVVPAPGMVPS